MKGWLVPFLHVLKEIVLYFAGLLMNLKWPQVFLVFLLLFPRHVRGLLVALTKLLERIKTFHWGAVQGELEETSKVVEKAELSNPPIKPWRIPEAMPAEAVEAAQSRVNDAEAVVRAITDLDLGSALLGREYFPMAPGLSPLERFVKLSKAIETAVMELCFLFGLRSAAPRPFGGLLSNAHALATAKIITPPLYSSLRRFSSLRSHVVHEEVHEGEVWEALDLGIRVLDLVRSIPRPEYRVVEPNLLVFRDAQLTQVVKDVRIVRVQREGQSNVVSFLTTSEFAQGTLIVPTAKLNNTMQGDYFYSVDGNAKRIVGCRYDFSILYVRR